MSTKRVALIAHDNKKKELIEWSRFNLESMRKCEIYATGTTGQLIEFEIGLKVSECATGVAPVGRGGYESNALTT